MCITCAAHADLTVHTLGLPYDGPAPEEFWSPPGSIYHHHYPVGYSATKTTYNKAGRSTDWTLTIESQNEKPLFRVSTQLLHVLMHIYVCTVVL